MRISVDWLQTYFEKKLPKAEEIARGLTLHAFEVEGIIPQGKDTILDVKVLPNRAHDCLCHYGIAKEVSAIFNVTLSKKLFGKEPKTFPQSNEFAVEIKIDKVKRFKTAVIKGIRVGPSPDWLRERIEAMGGKSINNIVDITNLVMFEIGQPMHAFDADKLKGDGKSFIIRQAQNGEKVKTLDGVDRELKEGAILITDGGDKGKTILGIAGIKGGAQAEITEKTKNIILEAATFDAPTIRRHAKFLNIRTDASIRFENGLAPEIPSFAIDLAVKLLEENVKGDGFVVEGEFDYYPGKLSQYKLGVSLRKVNNLLGEKLTPSEIEKIFEGLQLEYKEVNPEETIKKSIEKVLGKKYKADSSMRKDAPEFFSCSSLVSYLFTEGGIYMPSISIDKYVYGDKVLENELKFGDLIFSNTGESRIYFETVEYMKGKKVPEGIDHVGIYLGNNEVLHATRSTGTVVKEKIKDSKQFKNIIGYRRMCDLSGKRFVVSVPFERLDLRIKEDLIEEIGRIYGFEHIDSVLPENLKAEPEINEEFYKCQKIRQALVSQGFSEVYTYALVDKGVVEIENPLASDKNFLRKNLSDGIKKALETNSRNAPLLGLSEIKIFEIGKVFGKNGESLSVCTGVLAKRKPEVSEYSFDKACKKFNVSSIGKEILEAPREEAVKYIPISPFPFVLRDIALWVPGNVAGGEVEKVIRDNASDLLKRSDLFDEFKKEDKISYAYHLVFQSNDRTLTDEEVNKMMEKIYSKVAAKGWQVR